MGIRFPSVLPAFQAAGHRKIEKQDPASIAQMGNGLEQTLLLSEPNPNYLIADAETVSQGKCGSIIIQGRDRPGTIKSGVGYGIKIPDLDSRTAQPGILAPLGPKANPVSHAACIDLIAGLSGVLKRSTNSEGESVLTNKSTELDSARIYMTQCAADIDSKEYFTIAKGSPATGSPQYRSAIVLKSDLIRVVGREGIKIVTGTDIYQGSRGMNVDGNIGGIDLIAGNDDSDLQPMVKGDHLVTVLDLTTDLIDDLQSSVYFNLELLTFLMLSFADPTGVSQKRLSSLIDRLIPAFLDLYSQDMNYEFHKANYGGKFNERIKKIYNPLPKYNFRSKYNHVN